MITGNGLCRFCRAVIVNVPSRHVLGYENSYWLWCPACRRSGRTTGEQAKKERLIKRGQYFSDAEWLQGYKVILQGSKKPRKRR
jgi:hypothetical protein